MGTCVKRGQAEMCGRSAEAKTGVYVADAPLVWVKCELRDGVARSATGSNMSENEQDDTYASNKTKLPLRARRTTLLCASRRSVEGQQQKNKAKQSLSANSVKGSTTRSTKEDTNLIKADVCWIVRPVTGGEDMIYTSDVLHEAGCE